MKYPFQPELLDALPEELADLFRGLCEYKPEIYRH